MQQGLIIYTLMLETIKICVRILPVLQSPFGPATVLAGQTHATDLLGRESVTTQVWLLEHGFPIAHGF